MSQRCSQMPTSSRQSLVTSFSWNGFDEDGHALFVDDAAKFNHTIDEFVQSWPEQ
jgi:hypothetical protein